jgi:hypothetical protein
MQRSTTAWCLAAGFAAIILLSFSLGHRKPGFAGSDRPLEDWDILELVAHLQRSGMNLRLFTVNKKGSISPSVFLATQPKEWDELNLLHKDPTKIAQWEGVLYCERVKGYDPSFLVRQWGESCLWVEPFLFYGDGQLLADVRAALHPNAPRAPAH